MNAVRLRIDGPSYRQRVADDREKKHAEKRGKRRRGTTPNPPTES